MEKLEFEYDFHSNYELMIKKNVYSSRGLCGLVNLGNKCFITSILQCLNNSLKLTDFLLSNKFKNDVDVSKKKSESCFIRGLMIQFEGVKLINFGASPSGKALGFGPSIPGFESLRPNHDLYPKKWTRYSFLLLRLISINKRPHENNILEGTDRRVKTKSLCLRVSREINSLHLWIQEAGSGLVCSRSQTLWDLAPGRFWHQYMEKTILRGHNQGLAAHG